MRDAEGSEGAAVKFSGERRRYDMARLSLEMQREFLVDILRGVVSNPDSINSAADTLMQLINDVKDTDYFTGLKNKTGLMKALKLAITLADESGVPLSALFIDGDKVNEVNKQLGQHIGDRLIQAIANGIRNAALRQTDTAAHTIDEEQQPGDAWETTGRHGGDEFVVILPGTDKADAREVARRVAEAIAREANLTVPEFQQHFGRSFSASIGAAQYNPATDSNPEGLLARADANMREIKQANGLARN